MSVLLHEGDFGRAMGTAMLYIFDLRRRITHYIAMLVLATATPVSFFIIKSNYQTGYLTLYKHICLCADILLINAVLACGEDVRYLHVIMVSSAHIHLYT